MARIFSGKSFARKDVAQMGSALGAENLRTASVGIRFAAHGTRNFIVEAGPAAAGFKFGGRIEQLLSAGAAAVASGGKKFGVLARERRFSSFFAQNPIPGRREFLFPLLFAFGYCHFQCLMLQLVEPRFCR